MNVILLTHKPLDVLQAAQAVSDPSCGAVVTFLGNVRGTEEGTSIDAIVYESYAAMAFKELEKIKEAARGRWGVAVAILHRLGRVPVGEPSLAVAVASPHRREAFEACRFIVDELKKNVPIWKVRYESIGVG